jgi:hypothetical protein
MSAPFGSDRRKPVTARTVTDTVALSIVAAALAFGGVMIIAALWLDGGRP